MRVRLDVSGIHGSALPNDAMRRWNCSRASGVSHIGFGTESASPEVLRLMNKRHQHVPDIAGGGEEVRQGGNSRHVQSDLRVSGGARRPQARDVKRDGRNRREVRQRHLFSEYVYSLSGSSDLAGTAAGRADRAGFARKMGGYRSGNHAASVAERERVTSGWSASISYFLLDASLNKTRRRAHSSIARSLLNAARKPLLGGCAARAFRFPVELWIALAQRRLTVRRSLLTGQPLSLELSRNG